MTQHPSIRSIEQVVEADLCLGCGACHHVAPDKIQVQLNHEGYLRPVVASGITPAEQAQALAVCPGIHVEHQPPLPAKDLMWGPIQSCQAGWATDSQLRHTASSGGGLSALASYLLTSGEVDAVLHIGVSATDPLLNEYRISTTPAEVAANAGSRYAPAAPLLGLRAALQQHARVAFIGKPCDVVAMRKLAAVSPEVQRQVKYCLSFMCAGVPSIKGTHAVLKALKSPQEQVVQFRYRGNGWPGLATAVLNDGTSNSMTYDDSWGKILNKHLQFRCKVCFDGTGEFADITCADAWHGDDKGYPSFEEQDGRSLILARTDAGTRLLQQAKAHGAIATEALPVSALPAIQPYQRDRKLYALSRLTALKISSKRHPSYPFRALLSLASNASPAKNLRNFLGTLKRVASRRVD